jgi:hypothetical protein
MAALSMTRDCLKRILARPAEKVLWRMERRWRAMREASCAVRSRGWQIG